MAATDERWCGMCSYDGTDFAGWQSQSHGNSIQDCLERRLERIFHRPISVVGAGRTDSGVHALGQVFHFDCPHWPHGADALRRALGCGLPPTLRPLALSPIAGDFHAQRSAIGKRYVYRLDGGPRDPFHHRYRWSVGRSVSGDILAATAPLFLGEHDFTAFANRRHGAADSNHRRTIFRSEFLRRGALWSYIVEGNGFLYRMVRRMVGALVEVARGKISSDDLLALLHGEGRVTAPAAPPQGLFLDRVFYLPGQSPNFRLPDQDSNLDKWNQNPVCYRYTIGQCGDPDTAMANPRRLGPTADGESRFFPSAFHLTVGRIGTPLPEMGQAVYGRILLKLSGESLAGDGASIDWSAFEPIGRQIAQIRRMGVGIGIVIGGGNIYRGRMGTFSRETGDRMGMLATEINGLALREFLGRLDVPCQLRSSLFPRGGEFGEARRAMDEGQTIIFSGGTGLPYFSTDTAAALRALEIGASVILKASTVDGIYDRDPRRDPAAKQFRRLTYDEAIRRRLDDVLDGEAFCLCRTHGIGLVIFNVRRPDALLGAVRGEEVGTLVTEGGTTE